MNKTGVVTLGWLLAAVTVCAQQQPSPQKIAPESVRLDPAKPTAYLGFDRRDGQDVWLRLRNNSRWAVGIRTEESLHPLVPEEWAGKRDALGLLDGAVVNPAYWIENYPHEKSVYRSGCTFARSWVPPGRSVLFRVAAADLGLVARLRVMFKYEWESADGPEPEHNLVFTRNDLLRAGR